MKRFIASLIAYVLGCRHSALSRVFTLQRRTYQVCFDCGAQLDYSLETMSLRSGKPDRSAGRDRTVCNRRLPRAA